MNLAAVAALTSAAVQVLDDVDDTLLARPTPCHVFDVEALLRHWHASAHGLRHTLLADGLDPVDPWGLRALDPDADLVEVVAARLQALAETMAVDGITEGRTRAGLPKSVTWDMGVAELGLHAWDLAAALGRPLELDAWSARELLRATSALAPGARGEGTFAPARPCPPQADDLTRAAALSGRDVAAWAVGVG